MQAAQALDSDGKGAEAYSYEALISKPDLTVVELPDSVPMKDGKLDRSAVLAEARENAKSQEHTSNTEKETFVYVPDIGLTVRVAREGIDHGLSRNSEDTALATMKIGELLSHSIAVNELDGRTTKKKETEMSYVLISVAQNKKDPYLVRIVVDKNTRSLSEISTYGLGAVKAKKEGTLFMPEGNVRVEDDSSVSYLRSTISISDLLENVKSLPLANEVFSMDVLEKLGVARSKGTLSDSVRYSMPQEDTGNAESTTKPLPGSISESFTGAQRFSLGEGRADIAVVRMGDLFYLYDYGNERLISEAMDLTALNELLADHARWEATRTKEKEKAPHSGRATERRGMNEETRAIAQLLRENIPAYDEKLARDRTTLRRIYRQATAHGMSIEDALAFTAVAARTGLNIVFDKNRCVSNFGDGGFRYARGFYLSERGTIVINPDAKAELVLIHELDHALRTKYKNGNTFVRVYEKAVKALPAETRKSIVESYEKVPTGLTKEGQYADEANAHYAELALGNMEVVRYLVTDTPSLKQRILAFFKKASADYAGIPKLDRAAKKYLKQFKKEFDALSTKESGSLAVNEAVDDALATVGSGATSTDVDTDTRFALPYDDAIEKLENGTLDTTQNTHLRVLEHTPQIYIDRAGASDREIVMSWDIAYLAMNKNGTIPGNYHGLGAEVMKALPAALEDPLYIVKQKNGRIAAVTKIVVKGKRAVFASIELEAYQTTIQEGETEAKKYNLVVTVTDAKPNYLQNTIFSGEIVHNKNSEDPAHFILRLKSLEKAVPTYDLAGSSDNSITENAEKSNPFGEKSLEKVSDKQFALPLEDLTPAEEQAQEQRQRDIPRKRDAKSKTEKKLKAIFSTKGSYEMLRSVYGLKDLSPKSIHEMCNQIWRGMSSCVSADEKAVLAENTADYILAKLMTEDRSKQNPAADEAKEKLAYLRSGIGKLTFTDADVAELQYAFGKDGMRRIRERQGRAQRGRDRCAFRTGGKR